MRAFATARMGGRARGQGAGAVIPPHSRPRGVAAQGFVVTISESVLNECQRVVGYQFRDLSLLVTALTHASIAESRLASNERLEFLGDAVLGMVVCDYLFHTFPQYLEGDLTKVKSAAVSRRMCARIANDLQLDKLLNLGKGMKTRSSIPSSLSAAVLESVIGAIYLDAGIDRAREFLLPHLRSHIEAAAQSGHQQNFKSVLQQHAQQKLASQPNYMLINENGPDHAKAFEVAVEVAGVKYPSCWANSKKQAEQLAALAALKQMGLIIIGADGEAIVKPEEPETAADVAAELPEDAAGDGPASEAA